MSSCLLSALLSQCSDIENILDTLCWPSYSWPEIEKVESLSTLIVELIKESNSSLVFKDFKTKERFVCKVQSIIWDQCVPLLKMISNANLSSREGGGAQNAENKEMLNAVCGLLGLCVRQSQTDSLEKMSSIVLPVLTSSESDERSADSDQLDIDIAIEVMAVLLSGISQNAALTMESLSSTLTSIKELSDARVSKIIVRIWLTSLKSSTLEIREEILHRVWEDLLSWHDRENTEVVTARVLLCLTAFSDYLFPLEQQLLKAQQHHLRPDPRTSRRFFRVVQTGLTHRDGVSRKRALYLLKKCVSLSEEVNVDVCVCEPDDVLFRWTPDQRLVYREFWEDYALVLETLEENQIHVVRPVLPRIDALAKATAPDAADGALVHPSWLLCVYERMFHSENKAVMKDGVNHLLGLHLLQCPAFALSVSKFVAGPFMDVLTETSLYHRSPGQAVGECPELGLKLQNFMVRFFSSLPEENRGSVLLQALKRLASPHWCAVPLFFLSQALSGLSPCPLLRGDGLRVLREVLRCTMITHQVLLRGATQCLLLHTAICLTDVAAVSLEEVFAFLVHFRADESLHRGTTLWTKLRDWLVANEAKFQPVEVGAPTPGLSAYTSEFLQAFLTVSASSADQAEGIPAAAGEAEVAARAVLLSADAEGGGLERLLRPLLDVLRRLATSAYLPPRKSDRSLQVALRLLQLVGASSEKQAEREDKVAVALRRQLLSVVEPVQEFILRRLNGELQELRDLDRAALYHSLLGELMKTYCSVPGYLSNLQKNYVPRLTENCLRILNASAEQTPSFAGQVQKAVSMATLALLCELADQRLFDQQLFNPRCDSASTLRSLWTFFSSSPSSSSSTTCFTQTLQKPLSTTEISELSGPDNNSLPLRDWGRVAARYVRDQWTCLSFLHRHSSVPAEMGGAQWSSASIAAATEALVLLPGRLALPALDFIRMALPQVAPQEDSLCAEAVAASWRLVQASSTNSHDFWSTLQAFVRLAFQRSTLELTEAQSPEMVPRLHQVTGEMMELAQVKSGVLNELIQHCSRIWLPSETDPSADSALRGALNHLDVLSEACVYGPVFRRDQRIVQEVQTYVEQLGEECAANTLIGSAPRDDQYPRVCALALLNRLDAGEELQNSLMEKLVERLLGKDEKISKSKVRYYSNSMQHRVKNRVWQILLVLLPKLRPGFVADCVLPAALHAASCSNQASVKYLVEWAIILILHLWPNLIHHLWDSFSADHEKTKTSICTLLSVLVHLGVVLPHLENEAEQWQKAVELALLQCFSHIFTVRLYALLALKRLWALQARDGATLGAQQGGLSSAVRACLQQAEITQGTGNALKNWSKIQEHFFFSVFHPLNDYSVETIFHTFPSLSGLADDEWVPVWKFEKLVDFRSDSSLPLRNPGRALSQLQPGDWVQQDQGELEQEARWADVQKKIAPWRLSVQEQEPELMAQQRAARLGKLTGALLVVASLIDKPTNLGGLCRTCEIFGASALVLDSLRHISDKQFQALSVSSELWLPLLEVKPQELADFLLLKKKVGYCIVGVEQTANSQSLQDYRFPEKTLLLLGNEREGIPANLLQLLDVCVEIPQQGVTRSLNVHVSAALLVWEYTKQHPGSGRAT